MDRNWIETFPFCEGVGGSQCEGITFASAMGAPLKTAPAMSSLATTLHFKAFQSLGKALCIFSVAANPNNP